MNRKSIIAILAAACLSPKISLADKVITKASAEVERVKQTFAPDKRQNVFDVSVIGTDGGRVAVDGVVSEQWLADTLLTALKNKGIAAENSLVVYPDDRWALPRISVVSLRTGPRHAAEMATQALMGMPLRVLAKEGEWIRVQTPDGYISWSPESSLALKSAAEMDAWRKAQRMVVTSPYQIRAYNAPKANGLRDVVTDLVLGNIVELTDAKARNGRVEVMLPDGRRGWVAADALTPIDQWAAQDFDAEKILDIAYSMEGTPYLWGGTSVKSIDCSGLAKTAYLANGIILMRDASQQALTGQRIEAQDWPQCRAGDLLFFGSKTGRVTHVAIYDKDGNYVHSSGRVKRNSVDPKSDSYLTTPFLHAVRINGKQGTDGITRAADHPWYFTQGK